MPIFLYIVPWIELFFAFFGVWMLLLIFYKKGWLLGSNKRSDISNIIHSLGMGVIFGVFFFSIIVGHFSLY